MGLLPDALIPKAQDMASQWMSWLERPENKRMLMQTGISLMQPVGVGQSPIGHLGASLGEGMEARDRGIQAETTANELKLRQQDRELDNAARRKGLSLQERSIANQERNTSSMIQSRADSKNFTKMWARNNRLDDLKANFLQRMAVNAEKEDDELLGGQGRTVADFLADPAWLQNMEAAYQASRGSTQAPQGATQPAAAQGMQPSKVGAAQETMQSIPEPTAVNKQTGERLVYRNGQWVPLK